MLEKTYRHTPIVLLSSLAQGADRLVARTALECGVDLYVVLPMPANLYEQDFTSAESIEEFRRLMSRSFGSVVVPIGKDQDAQTIHAGPARDLRYAAAGAFVVSHSEILIALWDGVADEMPGGTSQIVRFALQGVPANYLGGLREALGVNETGAVFHVPVRRESTRSQGQLSVPTWLYPEADASDRDALKAARDGFEENLRNLERFNRDASAPPLEPASAVSAGSLLTSGQEALLDADAILHFTRGLFGQADALALTCRNWTHAATVAIFSAIGVAAVLFSVYTNLLAGDSVLYFVFLGIVAAALGIDLTIISKRMQDRFQDYRALAEGLRVQFFWRLAGIHDSVYDHYFARQEGELDWIRNAMRAAQFREQDGVQSKAAGLDTQWVLEVVRAEWIDDQRTYFSNAVRKEREMARRIRYGANACLVMTGVVAALLAVSVVEHAYAFHGVLVMLLTLALAGAGLFTGYAQKRAHEEHARRYQRMYDLYNIAGDRLAFLLRERELAAARAVLVQLGREALAETCDWLLLHRERQINVPTA
jgi:hypothetical protein